MGKDISDLVRDAGLADLEGRREGNGGFHLSGWPTNRDFGTSKGNPWPT